MSDRPRPPEKADDTPPQSETAPPPRSEEDAKIVDRHRTERPVEDLGGEID